MRKFNYCRLLFGALTLAGCASYSVISTKPESPVVIDGKLNDWSGNLSYLEDEKCAVGISNDSKNLYISLITSDRTRIVQILRLGLTVWIMPSDGKTIGIEYPLQLSDLDPMNIRREMSGRDFDIGLFIKRVIREQKDFKIVNEDSFPLNAYAADAASPYKVAIGYDEYKFIYEIKVPLSSKDNPEALVKIDPAENFEIAFEGSDLNLSEMRNRSPNRDSGFSAGKGGRGGRGGRRMDGRPDRPQNSMIDKIDFTVISRLSK